MNINPFMIKLYGNFHLLGRRKNKAKTNPIKPNPPFLFEPKIGFIRRKPRSLKQKKV